MQGRKVVISYITTVASAISALAISVCYTTSKIQEVSAIWRLLQIVLSMVQVGISRSLS